MMLTESPICRSFLASAMPSVPGISMSRRRISVSFLSSHANRKASAQGYRSTLQVSPSAPDCPPCTAQLSISPDR